ncbi:MAG: hypothetical protein KZQ64_13530 [gamma proteobacterium symbiont of Bathyaustriella thionipta]|nr:hypothetical protein [gamma proteobacterium symbiont of Bathyaustriella thionipta]MCU7949654.1 hypothetical protein [gamma proteobacterium symbiont of Bathyaustriella thionipta]MCU7954390.1 hypothetical protein [gamma proteobacterium symbiont of Bathyaustriella thionipta]MCU7956233.1 hypothetical protein [gamma proteobacterium symbiont of Bathyaustriella thionipta]MCU7966298.1 hypothetical protein [gamma proteobacterium symbiont of Bathyaustriella thionipta]
MTIFSSVLKKIFCIIFVVLISQVSLAASDDDYLKQLELEAGDDSDDMPAVLSTTEGDNSTNGETLDAPSSENELILDKKKLIVDITTFEAALRNAYRESYELYIQLNDEQKQIIYQGFTEHKRLYNSSVKIISVYLSTH